MRLEVHLRSSRELVAVEDPDAGREWVQAFNALVRETTDARGKLLVITMPRQTVVIPWDDVAWLEVRA
jgi:hypothetical protein